MPQSFFIFAAIRDVAMNRIEHDRLAAEIIGEAAFALLQRKGPINKHSLIKQLEQMGADESDAERGQYIAYLVTQLSGNSEHFLHRDESTLNTEQHRDNVFPLFGTATVSGSAKKH
ncbi:hypothetical protein CQW29_22305 [Pantoea coffeiphila]|uniref:Uncharacterized protein n=2 Tax=Enterobacterales TaxID=91347 RepID=A0A2S9I5Z6_9GAMM|nr:hypothetical protein CQW29_22305 [Pantoea coffeiphila]